MNRIGLRIFVKTEKYLQLALTLDPHSLSKIPYYYWENHHFSIENHHFSKSDDFFTQKQSDDFFTQNANCRYFVESKLNEDPERWEVEVPFIRDGRYMVSVRVINGQ